MQTVADDMDDMDYRCFTAMHPEGFLRHPVRAPLIISMLVLILARWCYDHCSDDHLCVVGSMASFQQFKSYIFFWTLGL